MSSPSNTTFSSSTFDTLFNAALENYTKRTGKDLRNHPLASKIDSCDGPDSILDIFQEQARAFDEFKRGDTKLLGWLRPVVNVLHALSTKEWKEVLQVLRGSVAHVNRENAPYHSFGVLKRSVLGISSSNGGFLRYRDPSICEYLVISILLLSQSRLPDGQICKGKLRSPSRYLRMHRELP